MPKLKYFLSRLAVVFAQSIEARWYEENEDVVGATLTGDAPTTSEWLKMLLPTEVQLRLEVWQYYKSKSITNHLWDDTASLAAFLCSQSYGQGSHGISLVMHIFIHTTHQYVVGLSK